MVRTRLFAVLAALALESCVAEPAPDTRSVMIALANRDIEAVRIAAAAGRGLEDRDSERETPLLLAVTTGQYQAARILVESGADIWAYNEFGQTVGRTAEVIKPSPATPDGQAREWLLAYLRERGFPFPAPKGDVVLDLVKARQWPPSTAKEAR